MAIRKCDCVHEFQDKRYGEGNRVHTEKVNGSYVCTVCVKVKSK